MAKVTAENTRLFKHNYKNPNVFFPGVY